MHIIRFLRAMRVSRRRMSPRVVAAMLRRVRLLLAVARHREAGPAAPRQYVPEGWANDPINWGAGR